MKTFTVRKRADDVLFIHSLAHKRYTALWNCPRCKRPLSNPYPTYAGPICFDCAMEFKYDSEEREVPDDDE